MKDHQGKKAPVITHAYAVEKGRYDDIIKVYLEADDPDGEMLRIATVVDQAGYGRYPTDWVYLDPQYNHRFAGYLEWNPSGGMTTSLPEWTEITIAVSVFDKAGLESNGVIFPFEFVSEVIAHPPPPPPFNVTDLPRLGHVTISLSGGREF